MKRIFSATSIFCFVCFLFFSCKKETTNSTAFNTGRVDNGIQPYPFNWETANYIPVPAGHSQIPVPWGSTANTAFSQDVLTDYKKSDGWVMVYNLFNTSTFPTPGYFMLYNRYRGLLRIYYYQNPSTPIPSNYITHHVYLGGSSPTTSILNFAGNDIVNLSANLATVSQPQPYQIISSGGWYSAEFEMAYDKNIGSKQYSQALLNWAINSTNITQVNLDGSINGSLEGTIQTPASKPNLLDALVKGAFFATGAAVLSNNPTLFPKIIQDAIKGSITSGLQGAVKNTFSAIFGGSSGNTQQVHLTVNADIKLQGNETNNSQEVNNQMYIPGTANNQTAPGMSPGYNSPLGVFNLDNVPIVNKTTTKTLVTNPNGTYYRYENTYTIQSSSINISYNPAVINTSSTGAQIQNLKKEVVLINPTYVSSPETVQFGGVHETVGTYDAYTGQQVGTTYTVARVNPANTTTDNLIAVRISFDVVPNNGAPKSKLVKTFYTNFPHP